MCVCAGELYARCACAGNTGARSTSDTQAVGLGCCVTSALVIPVRNSSTISASRSGRCRGRLQRGWGNTVCYGWRGGRDCMCRGTIPHAKRPKWAHVRPTQVTHGIEYRGETSYRQVPRKDIKEARVISPPQDLSNELVRYLSRELASQWRSLGSAG